MKLQILVFGPAVVVCVVEVVGVVEVVVEVLVELHEFNKVCMLGTESITCCAVCFIVDNVSGSVTRKEQGLWFEVMSLMTDDLQVRFVGRLWAEVISAVS